MLSTHPAATCSATMRALLPDPTTKQIDHLQPIGKVTGSKRLLSLGHPHASQITLITDLYDEKYVGSLQVQAARAGMDFPAGHYL